MENTSPNLQKFKFMKLPFLAQQAVVKLIEAREILELSFLSKRIKTILKLSKSKLKEGRWCIYYPESQIFLSKSGSQDDQITFQSMKIPDHRIPCCQDPLLFRASPTEFLLKWEGDSKKACDNFLNLMTFLTDLFEIQELNMKATGMIPDFSAFQRFKFNTLNVDAIHLTVDEAKLLLRGASSETLEFGLIHVNTPNRSMAHFELKVPKFRTYTAYWLDFSSILTNNCEVLNVEEKIRNLTVPNLCEFVKKWMDGGFPKLKGMSLHLGFRGFLEATHAEYEKEICEGLEAMGIQTTDIETSKQIQRSDGKTATFFVDGAFKFFT